MWQRSPGKPAWCDQKPERQAHPGCGELQLNSADNHKPELGRSEQWAQWRDEGQGTWHLQRAGFTALLYSPHMCLFFGIIIPLVDFNNQ